MRKHRLTPESLAVTSFAPVESVFLSAAVGGSQGTGCRDCTYEPVCPTAAADCPTGPVVTGAAAA